MIFPKIPLKINLNGCYKITLFADDSSIIVKHANHNKYGNDVNVIKKITNGLILTFSLSIKNTLYTIFDTNTIILMN